LRWGVVPFAAASLVVAACGGGSSGMNSTRAVTAPTPMAMPASVTAPSPDPRVGLKAGLQDAGEAIWNLQMVSHTPRPDAYPVTNSDLAFSGHYVIQGNYDGVLIWDVTDPSHPQLSEAKQCPASQDDVSVYKNLLFVSSEAGTGRLDCGPNGPRETVSKERLRGVRIFDITDIHNPRNVANVQTCRGSHTHTVVNDPKDPDNVYVYISGTSGIRPAGELSSCVGDPREANTSLFNIEVIKVPLAHPELAAVVSHPRIFADMTSGQASGLVNRMGHGASPMDTAGGGRGRGRGFGAGFVQMATFVKPAPGGKSGQIAELRTPGATATGADSATFRHSADSLTRSGYQELVAAGGRGGRFGRGGAPTGALTADDSLRIWTTYAVDHLSPMTQAASKADSARYYKSTDSLRALGFAVPYPAPARGTLSQCHDITAYPNAGYAGGACAGMGLLLDIHDPANPRRLDAVSDSNFSFWHSATFSNDGDMVLFSDEWGGGGAAYCRSGDPKTWGGDAIFRIVNGKMVFQSYYKLPAAQTAMENCVAHNGSLIPIPGRTVMVQAWYQGGLSIFDWSDPAHPHEIAFFDRGPIDSTRLVDGGFWSIYWYNGLIYGSEIARGLDVFALRPSAAISQNEIDAAKTVHFDFLNVQDQPHFVWPATFALSRAYADQLERWHGLSSSQVANVRTALTSAESMNGGARREALNKLASTVGGYVGGSSDQHRVTLLETAVKDLASATR
jgi:hypothetical protein